MRWWTHQQGTAKGPHVVVAKSRRAQPSEVCTAPITCPWHNPPAPTTASIPWLAPTCSQGPLTCTSGPAVRICRGSARGRRASGARRARG